MSEPTSGAVRNSKSDPQATYAALLARFARGWNTWHVRSVFTAVRMPDGAAIRLGFKDYVNRRPLTEANLGFDLQDLRLGGHEIDGSYTDATLVNWGSESHAGGLSFRVQSAHAGDDFVALIEPVGAVPRLVTPLLLVAAEMLWNRPGSVRRGATDGPAAAAPGLEFDTPEGTTGVFVSGRQVEEYYVGDISSPYLAVPLGGPVAVATGSKRSVAEVRELVAVARRRWEEKRDAHGEHGELWDAMHTALSWNTIWEPKHGRVVCPVSRRWSLNNRGYVLYLWDTYFAAYQAAAVGSRELAYLNLVEMTRAKRKADRPFVPNVEQANGFSSRDRSQPPVGSLCAREVYRIFGERWILELLYDDLVEWNDWWHGTRRYEDLLCYGSTPYEPVIGNRWETEEGEAVNGWFGASMESGWDGGVLYREVPFDKERHHLKHWDASLSGLYVLDCTALADIAEALGDGERAALLRERAAAYRSALSKLWNEKTGFFQNRNWETGEFSDVVAVNGFYPLLAGAATDEQAVRVANDYLVNPSEFWGRWAVSTLSRRHPRFGAEGEYWDGRVWPPVNFLVYLGLRNYYHLPEVRTAASRLVANSRALLLQDFRIRRLVRENYDVDTGSGDEAKQSAAFYHWGGLLALMTFVEAGLVPDPMAEP